MTADGASGVIETQPKQKTELNGDAKPETVMKRPQLLRLKSENGANLSVSGILHIDQTPTPTRLLNKLGEIFPTDNPFEQDFKKVNQQKDAETRTSPSEIRKEAVSTVSANFAVNQTVPQVTVNALPGPETISHVGTVPTMSTNLSTNTSNSQAEVQPNDRSVNDTTIEEIQSYDPDEDIENVGNEETIGEDDSNDKTNFRDYIQQPDTPLQSGSAQEVQQVTTSQPIMMTSGQNVVFASANSTFTQGSSGVPIMVMGGNQMVMNGNVPSPMRVVTAPSSEVAGITMNGQQATQSQAQQQQMIIPASGGTQMIVNGAINGAVQPFVMQQVMQIQDPNTGAIQTVITQPPQTQQFTMVQTVDPNSNGSSGNNNPPPTYTQCVMMPQQIQFVPQQFQMVPTNQHMLVNSQGQPLGQVQQQVQIINHGPVNSGNSQNGQSNQNRTSMITTIQQSPTDQKANDNTCNTPKSRSRTNSQLSGQEPHTIDQSVAKYNSDSLSNVVQLSKEALQAIEQAGNDCGIGKRGGPRLDYEQLDPKRRKFLERNRQAAARCRERKKQWIVSLECRANELKEDNRNVEEECIRLKTKLEQLRKVLAQQDRNIQSTRKLQPKEIEHDIATDSGVESAETLPSGEIIMAKTEMETES